MYSVIAFRPSVNLSLSVTSQTPKTIGPFLVDNKTKTWATRLLVEEAHKAAQMAHMQMHKGAEEYSEPVVYPDGQGPILNTSDFHPDSELFGYNVPRLQILILGYVFRLAETMSYRPHGILTGTKWAYFDRALWDTFVGPKNSVFRQSPPPRSMDGFTEEKNQQRKQWASRLLNLKVCMTHGLCNWLVKDFFCLSKYGGLRGLNELHAPNQMPFIRRIRK